MKGVSEKDMERVEEMERRKFLKKKGFGAYLKEVFDEDARMALKI